MTLEHGEIKRKTQSFYFNFILIQFYPYFCKSIKFHYYPQFFRMISIINSNSNIFGYILLAHHGWTIPEKCMKDVIIKLSFRNSSDRDYIDISATYLPGSNYFIFNTYFDNNFAEWGRKRGYYTFSVDIEVNNKLINYFDINFYNLIVTSLMQLHFYCLMRNLTS